MEQYTKEMNPHELAKKFESQIKEAVVKKFSVASEELSLLLEDKDGVYLSQEEADTLCCFVVGEKNGYLYLVTAKMTEDGLILTDFKSDIVS